MVSPQHLFVSRPFFAVVHSAGSANRLVPPLRQMLQCPLFPTQPSSPYRAVKLSDHGRWERALAGP
jgi:hypothetical protein